MADNKSNRKDRFTAQEGDFYFVDDPPKKKKPGKSESAPQKKPKAPAKGKK